MNPPMLYLKTLCLALAPILFAACNGSPTMTDAGPDGGDTETEDTDPYAVPEPTIEEPPPYADCEIEWVRTYEFPDDDVISSIAIGMTQLGNGNYLVVGGANVSEVGNKGLIMEIAPDGEMLRYALLGQDISFYHRAFETEDGYILFGLSLDSDDPGCTAMFLSKDFSTIHWEDSIGPEGYDTCFEVERREDGTYVFPSYEAEGVTLRSLDAGYIVNSGAPHDAGGHADGMVLYGDNETALTVNEYEDEYPYSSTPKMLFADGLEFTGLITYDYSDSTGYGEIFSTGDGNFLLRGGSSYYRAAYILYMSEEGFPLWAKYVGIENGPFVNNLVSDNGQYLFASGSTDWEAYAGRLDEEGSILWHYLHEEPGEISVWGVMKDTNDNGLVVYGGYKVDLKQAWLMKIKSNQDCY